MEILSTKGILESLSATLQDLEATPQAWSKTIKIIHQKGGPLHGLNEVLAALLDRLEQAARAKGVVRLTKSLIWPFTRTDVEQQLQSIDRQKLLLTLALENDHVALSREIQSDTQAIRQDVVVLRNHVAGIRSGIAQRQESEHRAAVLDWLSKVDYVAQQNDFISLRQPQTGDWLLECNEFKSWLVAKKKSLFCPGMPGAGKTILTSVVIDYFVTNTTNVCGQRGDVGIAYVYCNFRRQVEQTAVILLSTLLRQLVAGVSGPSFPPQSVQALYEKHTARQTQPSMEEILNTLGLVIALFPKVFILVDALDECQAPERNRFLSKILELQANHNVNIFATSRNVPDIVSRFRGAASVEIRATPGDVGRYVEGNMSHLPAFVRNNAKLQMEVRDRIVVAVDGMFLLAQLYLNSLMGKRSPKALRVSLANLPSGAESYAYDRAYDEAMERIRGQLPDQEELARQVLLWITCARRPLGVEELRHALAIEPDTSSLYEDNLPQIEDMVSVCAGLVTVDQESDIVRLVHYTTQSYFERTQARWFPKAEEEIAATCATHMFFDDFRTGQCQNFDEYEARLKKHRLYAYATGYWAQHVRHNSTIPQQVLDFSQCEKAVSASFQAYAAGEKNICMSPYGSPDIVPRYQLTGLHLAAFFNLEGLTRSLLLADADLNAVDTDSTTVVR
ncbi:hypothetical protein BT67DRAFT_375838 [Trichocladium antarcticum]|uniref:NACHT domain-containing protein n=1 Tax=Trichocladium antarcticum TaxID=1450529 RepID=A0AAN6UN75_9PEZI|nr:hypothetical protein BT67DRAFT_375838 [Trichocladium antarcticum]